MSKLSHSFRSPGEPAPVRESLCTLVTVAFSICVIGVGALTPQDAAADATPGSEPTVGLSGLPDGRLYEEATPTNKWGNQVTPNRPAFVSPDGQAVMYGSNGAVAEEPSNSTFFPISVSERTSHGWATRSAMPAPALGEHHPEEYIGPGDLVTTTVPSADLSHLVFSTWLDVPYVGPPDEGGVGNNVYLAGSDPFSDPQWIGKPSIESSLAGIGGFRIAGGSPDLKTIYFFYPGALLPNASRLYEYREGALSDAGLLPNGEMSAGLAVPAAQSASMISAAGFDNQVSADGSRLFFLRNDEAGVRELYARTTASDGTQSTILVSQSQLAGHTGEPAPDGPLAIPSTEWDGKENGETLEPGGQTSDPSHVFASPDGSHAFFQSSDRLTEAAPEDSAAKSYVFDLEAETLEYLPDLTGSIVTASDSGSSLLFENTATSPFELERWNAGPGGGNTTPIAELPLLSQAACGAISCVGPAYMSHDGSAVVFETESPIPGFNDGGSHYPLGGPLTETPEQPRLGEGPFPNREIFRYETAGNTLSCLSCPPVGQTPSSDAIMSKLTVGYNDPAFTGAAEVITPGRAVSADDNTVFFETRQALAPQDTNGKIDVYEWEDGKDFLISSGHDSKGSFLIGSSESGNDVFFMTGEGIAPGDKDGGAFDVYDARVPRPGDNPPPNAIPCEGAVCQGPPSVPELLGVPASEAFKGAENLAPARSGHINGKSVTRAQRLTRALKACRYHKVAGVRRRCEKQARRKYGAKAAGARHSARQARHHNGRGK